MALPRLYLGTMTFGWSQTSSRVDESIALKMVEQFVRHNEESGITEHYIDTARIYAGGKTEAIVGSVLSKVDGKKFRVGTKAHPSRKGGLSPAGIEQQMAESVETWDDATKSSLDEYYLHQPDTESSLHSSLEYLDTLVKKGVMRTVAMSNYHASEMDRAFTLCQTEGWASPTIYQGLYNPLNRLAEDELLPILRKNKCGFIAYNPLAAGLLVGKHTSLDDVQKGRFKNNQNYLPRFYTSENFEAVSLIRSACEEEGISMVEATYRWLLCHSALSGNNGDGILLGASSLAQLDENLAACKAAREKGPLPTSILDAFEKGWELTRATAFPYWRSYSSDMPNRESLDHGASYSAAKK